MANGTDGAIPRQWSECLNGFKKEQRRLGNAVRVEGLEEIGEHLEDLMSVIRLSDGDLMALTGYDEWDAENFQEYLEGYELLQ